MKPSNFLLWIEKRLLPLLCLTCILTFNSVPALAIDPVSAVIGMAAGGISIPFIPGMTPEAFGNQVANPFEKLYQFGSFPVINLFKSTKTHEGQSYSTVQLQGTIFDQIKQFVNQQIEIKSITPGSVKTYNISKQTYAGLPLFDRTGTAPSPTTNTFLSFPNTDYQPVEFDIGYFHISITPIAGTQSYNIDLTSPTETKHETGPGPSWGITAFAIRLVSSGTNLYHFQLIGSRTETQNDYVTGVAFQIDDTSHTVSLENNVITYESGDNIGISESDKAIQFSVPTNFLDSYESGAYTDKDTLDNILKALIPSLVGDQYIDVDIVEPGVAPTPVPEPTPAPVDPSTIGGAPVVDLWSRFTNILNKLSDIFGRLNIIPGLIDTTNESLNDIKIDNEEIEEGLNDIQEKQDETKDSIDVLPPLVDGLEQGLDDININVQEGNQSLNDIKNVDEDILESVEGSKGILEGIKDAFNDVGEWIREQTGSLSYSLDGIKSAVQSGVKDIVESLEGVLEGILEAIEEGPVQLFRTALGAIKTVFGDLLSRLSGILGIWHYVVEWFNSISTPFTFFFGSAQSISYFLILPIYACIAGIIVIAVYKRFGR